MESFGIILNVHRPGQKLTPSDLAILRETIKMAVSYDKDDQSHLVN